MALGYPKLPPAVGDGYPQPAATQVSKHPLLEKGTFELLHRNEVIETRPHILHFGGFQIHKEHSHVLRILNISTSSLRVVIIAPSTPFFKVTYDKKGLLAPGMSEEITVTFTPHEWRYYYDTVKIFCGDMSENLVVPIHAYPSANDISLPRIIDFGKVAIGTSRTKVIPLSCKIPIQFEFEIVVLENHPDFQVTPLQGVIPPDGTTNVVVTFLPTRHRTARAELQFHIAQFDFDPVTVTVCGSSSPDMSKQEVLQSVQSEMAVTGAQNVQDNLAERVRSLQAKKGRGPLEVKHPTHPLEVTERSMEGIKMPTTGVDAQATRFVLSQTAGKLPLKDLFSFIKDQREAAEGRKRRASKTSTPGLGDDNDGDDEDQQARELRFDMRFREIEKYDKDKELKSAVAIGEDPLTDEIISKVETGRRDKHSRIMENNMQGDIGRIESVLGQGKVAVPNSYKPSLTPQWDEKGNDSFSVRLQVIDRFVRAGSKALMRERADKRIAMLRDKLQSAGVMDRGACKAWVEAENRSAASGSAQQSGDSGAKGGDTGADEDDDEEKLEIIHISANFCLPLHLPTAEYGSAAQTQIEPDPPRLDNFEQFLPASLNERLDYKVFNYEKHSYTLPPASSYMRLQNDRHRLDAAREEHLIRGPRGGMDGADIPLAMPDSCLLPPAHDALSLLVPSTECRTYIALPEFTECDPEYWLSQPPPVLKPLTTEPLLPPNIMSLEKPWLESWRGRRQIADPFQYCDPFPCCFAEAGGSQGPRLGCDAGGERLAFLPVGGYDRDVPSDTDDDDREDFHIPPPTAQQFQDALSGLDGDVSSELWRKQQVSEEHLRSICDANSRAVRERLDALNQDHDYRHKLFLG